MVQRITDPVGNAQTKAHRVSLHGGLFLFQNRSVRFDVSTFTTSNSSICRYERMKTAVIGEGDTDGIVYDRALFDLARHYGFHPRACKPYRAKTKGKVGRPLRYTREHWLTKLIRWRRRGPNPALERGWQIVQMLSYGSPLTLRAKIDFEPLFRHLSQSSIRRHFPQDLVERRL